MILQNLVFYFFKPKAKGNFRVGKKLALIESKSL